MLNAVRKIEDYTAGLRYETAMAVDIVRDGVVFNFIVLGEAANNLPAAVTNQAPQIPWVDIVGLRHRLVHDYYGINYYILWETITDDLEPLASALRRMMNSEP
ncbi:MAG: DUF86 domain-containing protein [Chloroflexi bacterium]|nr:DUF86 domain-containing protein [Chloroflexota bacterium]